MEQEYMDQRNDFIFSNLKSQPCIKKMWKSVKYTFFSFTEMNDWMNESNNIESISLYIALMKERQSYQLNGLFWKIDLEINNYSVFKLEFETLNLSGNNCIKIHYDWSLPFYALDFRSKISIWKLQCRNNKKRKNYWFNLRFRNHLEVAQDR